MSGERIIIFSTHICSDVESVATRIAIVDRGMLLADDAPRNLLRAGGSLEEAYLHAIAGARPAA